MAELQHMINEKIFKKTMSRSGKTVYQKNLIGHIVAGIIDDQVAIGYSLLHKNDMYDVINGQRRPGHGKNLAFIRAKKWMNDGVVTVPPSIAKQVRKFKARCELYYKNAIVPDINEMEVIYDEIEMPAAADFIEAGARELLEKIQSL